MLIGIENFGGMPDSQFDTRLSRNTYKRIDIKNGIYDEIRADNDVSLPYSKEKREWEFYTVLLGTFNDTFEAGNLQLDGQEIDKLRFKKRLKGTMDWVLIDELEYSKTQNIYTVMDRLSYSLDEYEYSITPYVNGVEGDANTNTIKCEFDGLWLVDRNSSVKLYFNLVYGDIDHKRNINIIETLERRYPIVQASKTAYRTGSNSAVMMTTESLENGRGIDYLSDRKMVDNAIEFLGNGKPKIMKDGNGRKYIVTSHDIRESTKDGFNGGFHTVDFNWTEIGNPDSFEDLVEFGLLPEELEG